MKKLAAIEDLQPLRTAIVNFHQNMKIVYNDLYQASGRSEPSKIMFDKYHVLLANIAAAGVFGETFTLEQMLAHLKYLIGIIRPLASRNALAEIDDQLEGSANLIEFGKNIQNMFVPLATALSVPADETALIEKAPVFSNLLTKTGANLTTYIRSYLTQMQVQSMSRAKLLMKWAEAFEAQSLE